MRIALVISPPVRKDAPLRSEVIDTVRDRLQKGGFRIMEVTTSADLAADLDRVTASMSAVDSVLVYVAGATTLHDDGALALRLEWDGDDSLGFQAIGAPLHARGTLDALYIVDAVHDGLADDAMRATEHVEAASRATKAGQGGTSMLIGVSAEPNGDEARPWPLSHFLLDALDDPKFAEGGAQSVARAFERIREAPGVRAEIAGLAFIPGSRTFLFNASMAPSMAPRVAEARPSKKPRQTEAPRSMLPLTLPALEPILVAATLARELGQWEDALLAYKKALMVVGVDDVAARASIYASIAEVKQSQGKTREAEMNFEKALGAFPGHRRSLDALIELATDAKDWKRIVDYRRLIVASRQEPARKAAELCTIATLLETELDDGRAAAAALEEARELAPRDLNVLQRLRSIYEATQSWPKLVDLLGALCLAGSAPVARAELRFVQADVTLARLRDEPRGLELLEAALEEDPAHERSLAALIAVRTRREEWKELARTLARLADQCAKEGHTDRAFDICKRLALLRRDRLRDGTGAIEAYRGALHCKPRDADVRAMIAELLLVKGESDAALRELETASAHAPLRVATYRRLFELHTRAGRTDSAWLAAIALEELGAADADHDALIDQFRARTGEGTMRASAALDDVSWVALRARGVDSVVSAILLAVAPAAIGLRVEDIRARKKLAVLDPAKKQAATSTVSIVRTFAFASQVLGIKLPDLYVHDTVPGGLAAVPLGTPTTAIGPTVLRGMSVPTLAFLVARHLTYYRPEHYALIFFPSLTELSTLVLSAIKIALPKMPVSKHVTESARILEKELEKQGRGAIEQLAAAVRALDERNGKMDLGGWIRGVELTAHRAGLLLAGELSSVLPQMKGESREIADLSFDDKRGDLLAFCASRDLPLLRAQLGMAARKRTDRPPAPPGA